MGVHPSCQIVNSESVLRGCVKNLSGLQGVDAKGKSAGERGMG
jgi:hypothetical protein